MRMKGVEKRILLLLLLITAMPAAVTGSSCAATSNEPAATGNTENSILGRTGTAEDDRFFDLSNPYEGWIYFDLIIHSIETRPANLTVGKKADIWTNVYCSGNYETHARAFLFINRELVTHRPLIIPPDEDFPFVFSFTPEKSGVYEIVVRIAVEPAGMQADPYDTDCYHLDAFMDVNVSG